MATVIRKVTQGCRQRDLVPYSLICKFARYRYVTLASLLRRAKYKAALVSTRFTRWYSCVRLLSLIAIWFRLNSFVKITKNKDCTLTLKQTHLIHIKSFILAQPARCSCYLSSDSVFVSTLTRYSPRFSRS